MVGIQGSSQKVMNMDQQRSKTPVEQVIETVSSWPNVVTGEGRFNSTAFQVGSREIGHIHSGGAVDIGYPKRLRDQLIADGHTEEHHALPQHPNATTFHIESEDDPDNAVWLFRLSYLSHIARKQQGDADETVANVDVNREFTKLDVSDNLRVIFEDHFTDLQS